MTADLVIIGILVFVVGGVTCYLYRAKKRGRKCIGCPYADSCNGGCGGKKHDETES